MKNQTNLKNSFLEYFINNKCYLQNPPLKATDFIKEAEKRGLSISVEELESLEKQELLIPILRIKRPIGVEKRIYFKKDETEYYKLKKYGLEDGEEFLKEKAVYFYSSYGFTEYDYKILAEWYKKDILYAPEEKGYQSWHEFKGKTLSFENERIITFYSNFQLYWLEVLITSLNMNVNFLNENIALTSKSSISQGRFYNSGRYIIQNQNQISDTLNIISKDTNWNDLFSINDKKKSLAKQYKDFSKFVKFLLLIQSNYYPYARSGGKSFQSIGDSWPKSKDFLNIEEIINLSKINLNDILYWYKVFSEKAEYILGNRNKDWLQLWKNIDWDRKDNQKGVIRLGIDYLQWDIMLKIFIEDYLKHEIPDIDELGSFYHEDITKIDLNRWGGTRTLRDVRNLRNIDLSPTQYNELNEILIKIQQKEEKYIINKLFKSYKDIGFFIDWEKEGIYFDENKLTENNIRNYYKDRYKKLNYLANKFELDYQPKMTVFVEGESEEITFPQLLYFYYSKPEMIGIDFINVGGVDKFFSSNIANKSKDKMLRTRISNFHNLITYNLTRWQIIPFLVFDEEGNIKEFIRDIQTKYLFWHSICINSSSDLVWIWGKGQAENKHFKGNSFELANFLDGEIAKVLAIILTDTKEEDIKITPIDVHKIRNKNSICEILDSKYSKEIKSKKVDINKMLVKNLINDFNNHIVGKEIFKRPIFKLFDVLIEKSSRNHQPTDRISETNNKGILKNIIQKI